MKPLSAPVRLWLALFLLGLLSIHLNADWKYRHDDNGAMHSAFAHTHLLKGLETTRAQDFFLRRSDNRLESYGHHPPFPGLYLAAVFHVTGRDSPGTARSAFALLHLFAFFVFCAILSRLPFQDTFSRFWAALVFAVIPVSAFFGKMPNHETPGLLFTLTGLLAYLSYRPSLRGSGFLIAAGCSAWLLALFSSWQAVPVIAGILLFAVIAGPREKRFFAAVCIPILLLGIAGLAAEMHWAHGGHELKSLKQSIGFWVLPGSLSAYLSDAGRVLINTLRYFGIIPPFLALVWLVGFTRRALKKEACLSEERLFLWAGTGTVLFNAVFSEAARVHLYYQFYWLPFIAVQSAWALDRALPRLNGAVIHAARWARAGLAAATILLCLGFLGRLYAKPAEYAVAKSAEIQSRYY